MHYKDVVVCGGVWGGEEVLICVENISFAWLSTLQVSVIVRKAGMPSWPGLSGLGGRRQEKCDTGTLGEETTQKKSKCERLFIVFNVYFFTIPNYPNMYICKFVVNYRTFTSSLICFLKLESVEEQKK